MGMICISLASHRLDGHFALYLVYKNPDSFIVLTVRTSYVLPATPLSGGGGRIRTYVGISQQIYSLPSLAA